MRGIKHQLNEGWQDYLRAHYADTKNAELLVAVGLPKNSYRTLRRLASELGLRKSEAFMTACQRHAAKCAGDALRGVGNAGKRNLLLSVPHRFKPGVTNMERLGAEGERRRAEKSAASRRETVRKERIRIKWGLEQRTRMVLVRQSRQVTTLRNGLKRRGYVVPKRGSKIIYYNNNTRRSALMEIHALELGLTILAS